MIAKRHGKILKTESVMKPLSDVAGFEEALNDIRGRYDVDRILLFGSLARGQDDTDSDIDICVILNSRSERTLVIAREIRLSLFHRLDRAIDVLVYDKPTFEERRDAGASLERTISREGVAV